MRRAADVPNRRRRRRADAVEADAAAGWDEPAGGRCPMARRRRGRRPTPDRRRRAGRPAPRSLCPVCRVAARSARTVLRRLRLLLLRRPTWRPRPPRPGRRGRPGRRRPSCCRTASSWASSSANARASSATAASTTAPAPPVPVWIIRDSRCRRSRRPIPAAEPMAEADVRPAEARRRDPARLRRRRCPPPLPVTEVLPRRPAWPSIAWEQRPAATRWNIPACRAVIDYFAEDGYEYLIEEVPDGPRRCGTPGTTPTPTSEQRFGWLAQVAEALHRLHQCQRHARRRCGPTSSSSRRTARRGSTDLSDLLPLPLPPDAPDPRHAVHRARADGRHAARPTPAPTSTASAPCSTRCTSAAS